MSPAHGEEAHQHFGTLLCLVPAQLAAGGTRRLGGSCSANQVTVLLHKFPAEGGGVNGEGFQCLFLFLIVSCA